jgi:hypothetical protein
MTEISPNLDYFKWINGSNNETRNSISRDKDNNLYVIGSSKSSSITIDNITYTRNASLPYGLYIIKFNSNGTLLWLKWVEATNDLANELIVSSNNGNSIYITASAPTINTVISNNDVTYGTTTQVYNSFVLKINSGGEIQWLRILITNSVNVIYATTVDNNGNLYLVGTVSANNPNTLTFNNVTYTKPSGQDGFIMKINNNQNNTVSFIRWVISNNGATESLKNISIDNNGNLYIALSLFNPLSFNIDGNIYSTGVSSDNTNGIFLIKFDSNNTFCWIKNMNGTLNDYQNDIKADMSGNIILLGTTYSPSLTINATTYNRDTTMPTSVFLIKFDTNGNVINFLWINGNSSDEGGMIAIDTTNNIYITGYSISTALTINNVIYYKANGATKNAFIIKFNSNLKVNWIEWVVGIKGNNLKIILASNNEIYLSGATLLTSLIFKSVTYTKTGLDDATFIIKIKSFDVKYDINFVINEFISLNHNAQLASNAPPVLLDIDYSLSLQVNDLASLFPIKYQQNTINTELYNVDVSMNTTLLESYLNNNCNQWNINKINSSVITTGLTNINQISQSLLEIIALRIFGSGLARAAIINDTSIESELLSHKTDFLNVLANKKDDLFKAYVDSGRIGGNDVSQTVLMNLANTHISFPFYITGEIMDGTNNVLQLYPYSDGFSSYGGFGKMINGLYNIPVIVKFFQN